MAKVKQSKVEKVQDKYQLRNPEARMNPKKHECGLEEVVQNEVAADVGGCSGPLRIRGEKMPDVACL